MPGSGFMWSGTGCLLKLPPQISPATRSSSLPHAKPGVRWSHLLEDHHTLGIRSALLPAHPPPQLLLLAAGRHTVSRNHRKTSKSNLSLERWGNACLQLHYSARIHGLLPGPIIPV